MLESALSYPGAGYPPSESYPASLMQGSQTPPNQIFNAPLHHAEPMDWRDLPVTLGEACLERVRCHHCCHHCHHQHHQYCQHCQKTALRTEPHHHHWSNELFCVLDMVSPLIQLKVMLLFFSQITCVKVFAPKVHIDP